MIQLKRNKNGDYELGDKKAVVTLSRHQVKIGEHVFEDIGEYETDNIALVYGESACLIAWEQLQIVYLFSSNSPTPFEKNQFSASNILLIDHNLPEIKTNVFEQLMDAYDPSQVVISNSTTIEATSREALQMEEVSALKFQLSSLPSEGRDFYKLT